MPFSMCGPFPAPDTDEDDTSDILHLSPPRNGGRDVRMRAERLDAGRHPTRRGVSAVLIRIKKKAEEKGEGGGVRAQKRAYRTAIC
jgi:hypothetical protein